MSSTDKPQVDVTELLLRPDVQKAVTDVLQQLPKLAPLIVMAAKGADAAWTAITDAEFMGGLEEVVLEKAKPLRKKAADAMSICQEAKLRAERSDQYIGLFGLMRMLKDPTVQYALRYTQALMEVCSEHRAVSQHRTADEPAH